MTGLGQKPVAQTDGIYLGPVAPAQLVTAVLAAGGRLVPAAEATAFVWYGGSPAEFSTVKHPGIRWVQLPNAGVESWIAAGVVSADPVFTSAAGSYAFTVAEHTLAVLLGAARQIPQLARQRTWTHPAPTTVRGASITIVGCGGIGRALIQLLAPIGAIVTAVTRSGREVPGADVSMGVGDLHRALRDADYVVLAAPVTPQSLAMIGAAELAVMKQTSHLINVGRGSLVDTHALVDALKSGQIAGASMDVTDPEPLPDGHSLWSMNQVLITPHSANTETLLLQELAKRVHSNTQRFLAGQELIGVVELSRGY